MALIEWTEQAREPSRLVDRFQDLNRSLSSLPGWGAGDVGARYAAVTLLGCGGEAAEVAEAVGSTSVEIFQSRSFLQRAHPYVRVMLAATLVKFELGVGDFFESHDRISDLAQAAGLRYRGEFSVLASLVLRTHAGVRSPTATELERLAAIYKGMKKHHWWLTGADDLPACAMLTMLEGDGDAVEARAEAMYESLRGQGHFGRGNALQQAAQILSLCALSSDEAGARSEAIAQALVAGGVHVDATEYDEIALLCAVPGTPESLAQRVVECVDLVPNARQHDETRHLDLAASIAILSLDASPRVRAGVDLKLLMEVQGVAAKQLADQAAATGAS